MSNTKTLVKIEQLLKASLDLPAHIDADFEYKPRLDIIKKAASVTASINTVKIGAFNLPPRERRAVAAIVADPLTRPSTLRMTHVISAFIRLCDYINDLDNYAYQNHMAAKQTHIIAAYEAMLAAMLPDTTAPLFITPFETAKKLTLAKTPPQVNINLKGVNKSHHRTAALIINCLCADSIADQYPDQPPLTDFKSACKFLLDCARDQNRHDFIPAARKHPADAFIYWAGGLPSIFNMPFENYVIDQWLIENGLLRLNASDNAYIKAREQFNHVIGHVIVMYANK